MNPKIEAETPISIHDLKREMDHIKKRDEKLSVMGTKTEEYLNSFATLSQKDSESLEKELNGLEIPRFRDMYVKKVIDLMPESIDELKVILQGYAITISKENMQKIISALEKHIKKA